MHWLDAVLPSPQIHCEKHLSYSVSVAKGPDDYIFYINKERRLPCCSSGHWLDVVPQGFGFHRVGNIVWWVSV